jgi:protein TonB
LVSIQDQASLMRNRRIQDNPPMNSPRVEAGTYPISDDGRAVHAPSGEEPSGRPGSIAGISVAAAAALALHGLVLWVLIGLRPISVSEPSGERVISVFLLDDPDGSPPQPRAAQPEQANAEASITAPSSTEPSSTAQVNGAATPAAGDSQAPAALPPLKASAPSVNPTPVAPPRPATETTRVAAPSGPAPPPTLAAPPLIVAEQPSTGPNPITPSAANPLPLAPETRAASASDAVRGRQGPADIALAPASTTDGKGPATMIERTPVRVPADWAGNRPPVYPMMSRRLGEQGEIRLSVLVDTDGRAVEVRITRSSGSTRLDQSALDAVRQWRFTPATEEGRAVTDWYHDWRWEFRLER